MKGELHMKCTKHLMCKRVNCAFTAIYTYSLIVKLNVVNATFKQSIRDRNS